MKISQATMDDTEEISINNINMAKETEERILDPVVSLDAVKNLINNPSKGFYLLAKKEEKIIGQLMITFEWSDWRNTTIWWIQSVYVLPSYRKQKVFFSLYQKSKQIAKKQNIKMFRLYVYNQNKKAISTYESIGMKKKSYIIFEEDF